MTELLSLPRALVMVVRELDPDYVLIDIIASDGGFAGSASVYERHDVAETVRAQLIGFPRSPTDSREIVLGSFNPIHAGGGVRMVFSCVNLAGHTTVAVEIEDQPRDGRTTRSVSLRMPVEAIAIDAFVTQLQRWSAELGETATLQGA